ncbi:hypothetical protein CRYUN_Cryun26dG0100000 [Craigia yunnanensis]
MSRTGSKKRAVGSFTGTALGSSQCPEPLHHLLIPRRSLKHIVYAAGDNYLKPYVSCEREVTITDRTAEEEFFILASDGFRDVVSNDTAYGVARMCLRGKGNAHASPCLPLEGEEGEAEVGSTMGGGGGKIWDKACRRWQGIVRTTLA